MRVLATLPENLCRGLGGIAVHWTHLLWLGKKEIQTKKVFVSLIKGGLTFLSYIIFFITSELCHQLLEKSMATNARSSLKICQGNQRSSGLQVLFPRHQRLFALTCPPWSCLNSFETKNKEESKLVSLIIFIQRLGWCLLPLTTVSQFGLIIYIYVCVYSWLFFDQKGKFLGKWGLYTHVLA